MAAKQSAAVDTGAITGNILVIRGHRVLLDSDLASLYQVATKALTRAVRRNGKRFPEDFMFQLAAEETDSLRSQSGAFKTGRGKHRKYAPYVFTEQGVAMLSSVLNSDRAGYCALTPAHRLIEAGAHYTISEMSKLLRIWFDGMHPDVAKSDSR
jgi:hypothetical protein